MGGGGGFEKIAEDGEGSKCTIHDKNKSKSYYVGRNLKNWLPRASRTPLQGVPSGFGGVLEGFYFPVEGSWGGGGFQPPKAAKMVEKILKKS